MSSIWTVARKELRAYFLSPVALIFLGLFLAVTMFVFFTWSRFFARNLADVRPLFEWLPVLLIFLVSAVTMRQWSEEQRAGTLEILMTLPIKSWKIVVGKFVAGMALVTLALALTLPLPISVSTIGNLDWGPVVGGYLGAALLASAYMAIGLCVSARTDNQIVALMMTVLICGVLYLVGSENFVGLFSDERAELLRKIGSGSRFESIERGVLDLRDLVYYGSLTTFFLVLNIIFVELKRTDSHTGTARRIGLWGTALLVGLNAIAANVWMEPVTAARIDMTENGDYSLSDVSIDMIRQLDEPLVIRGFFSEKTHPKLAPLVPRIRDLLEEYEIQSGGTVTVDFADPSTDEDLETEIQESYGIESVPFAVDERNEKSVVNSYFHILVRYGDKHQVLSFNDLIEVRADAGDVEVRLRNLEYDVTRAIKRVTQEFQSLDSVLAQLEGTAKLTAYVTPETLPEEFAEMPERIKSVAEEIESIGGGRFAFEQVDPTGDKALQKKLYEEYGFRPMAVDLFGENTFYLNLLFEAPDGSLEQVFVQSDLSEAELRDAIEAAIRRATPGFLKTVGLFTDDPQPPKQMMPGMPPPKRADFRNVEQALKEDYTVRRVKLEDGRVPADIDVLIVGKPGELTEKERFALDQYLMQGGAVVVFAGRHGIDTQGRGLKLSSLDTGLLEMLEHYGFKLGEGLVLDPQNAPFPVPVPVKRGPVTLMRYELLPYPFFVDVRSEGFKEGHLALSGINNVILTWPSPIEMQNTSDLETEVLLTSSEDSWVKEGTEIEPKMDALESESRTAGFSPGENPQQPVPLAVTATGEFESFFAERPNPLFGEDSGDEQTEGKEADRTGRTLKSAVPGARLVVVSSPTFVSDLTLQIASQLGGGLYQGNMQLVRNLVSWSLEDTELLAIGGTGAFARTLEPLEEEEENTIEMVNYGVVAGALLLLFLVPFIWSPSPIPLERAKQRARARDANDARTVDTAAAPATPSAGDVADSDSPGDAASSEDEPDDEGNEGEDTDSDELTAADDAADDDDDDSDDHDELTAADDAADDDDDSTADSDDGDDDVEDTEETSDGDAEDDAAATADASDEDADEARSETADEADPDEDEETDEDEASTETADASDEDADADDTEEKKG